MANRIVINPTHVSIHNGVEELFRFTVVDNGFDEKSIKLIDCQNNHHETDLSFTIIEALQESLLNFTNTGYFDLEA